MADEHTTEVKAVDKKRDEKLRIFAPRALGAYALLHQQVSERAGAVHAESKEGRSSSPIALQAMPPVFSGGNLADIVANNRQAGGIKPILRLILEYLLVDEREMLEIMGSTRFVMGRNRRLLSLDEYVTRRFREAIRQELLLERRIPVDEGAISARIQRNIGREQNIMFHEPKINGRVNPLYGLPVRQFEEILEDVRYGGRNIKKEKEDDTTLFLTPITGAAVMYIMGSTIMSDDLRKELSIYIVTLGVALLACLYLSRLCHKSRGIPLTWLTNRRANAQAHAEITDLYRDKNLLLAMQQRDKKSEQDKSASNKKNDAVSADGPSSSPAERKPQPAHLRQAEREDGQKPVMGLGGGK